MIVADTNVIVPLVVDTLNTAWADRLYEHDPEWCAPTLWRHELRNVLVQLCRSGGVDWGLAPSLIAKAERQLADADFLVDSEAVISFARRSGCAAYDAEFAVLAEGLDLPLLTWDRELLRALPGRAVTPEDYLARP
jgi:predicted nucleic acid-binding protein